MSDMLPEVSFSVSGLNQSSSGDFVELTPAWLSQVVDALHHTDKLNGTAQLLRPEQTNTVVIHT